MNSLRVNNLSANVNNKKYILNYNVHLNSKTAKIFMYFIVYWLIRSYISWMICELFWSLHSVMQLICTFVDYHYQTRSYLNSFTAIDDNNRRLQTA